MKKLISFLSVVLFSVVSVFATDSLYSSCGDNLTGNPGEWVEASYYLSGDNLQSAVVKVNDGCLGNVLDNVTFTIGDKSYARNGYDIVCSFSQPAIKSYKIFTIKGKIQAVSSNPYDQGGAIKFMVYAIVNGKDSLSRQFGLFRSSDRTFEDVMGNGTNRIAYRGIQGYLVWSDAYAQGYMISDSGIRLYIPWTGNGSWSSLDYTNAVRASWGWDMSAAKKIPVEELSKYRVGENISVKPGYCAFHWDVQDKYYESTSLGVIEEITKEKAGQYGSDKIVAIPDCFIINYSIASATKILPKKEKTPSPFLRGATGMGACYTIDGRKIANVNRGAIGLNIVRMQNSTMAKNMNLNRRYR